MRLLALSLVVHNADSCVAWSQLNHIAHAVFWKNRDGKGPAEFSVITNKEVENGTWMPRDPSLLTHAKYYTRKLEEQGNFSLVIWPEHCLVSCEESSLQTPLQLLKLCASMLLRVHQIGSEGHAIVPALDKELQNWAGETMNNIEYILKGKSCLTEMYSAIEAEVPIPSDPSTQTDWGLLESLKKADQLLICGQAKSHCVNYTVKSIMQYWNVDKNTDPRSYQNCPDKCPADCDMCKNCARNITLLVDGKKCLFLL